MLDYTAKLTSSPGTIVEEDIRRLREVGLSDVEILDVNANTCMFNYINRVVTGLGVQPEEE